MPNFIHIIFYKRNYFLTKLTQKMKLPHFLRIGLAISLIVTGCIREEAPNMEADIEAIDLSAFGNLLEEDPEVGEDKITLTLKENPPSMRFAPHFQLSKGATISPENGTELDFSSPQKYIITSEDGKWQKEYLVEVFVRTAYTPPSPPSPSPSPSPSPNSPQTLRFSFENIEVKQTKSPVGIFHQFFEGVTGQEQRIWSSGNEGYNTLAKILNPNLTAESYPTYQNAAGLQGKSVTLVTKTTGALGKLGGAPLAAGSLFLGSFKSHSNPIKSTRFGIPYPFKKAPKNIQGHFKYTAGAKMTKTKSTSRQKDGWDIYAIVFEKSAKDNFLLGDHQFADSRMVSVAKLPETQRREANTWTPFEISFENIAGKSFDPNKEYFYTIVMSSSVEGGVFNGAEGSILQIDELILTTH